MKSRTGPIVNRDLIEASFQIAGISAASCIGPAEDLGGWLPVSIDTDKAVPEGTCRDVRLIGELIGVLGKYVGYKREDLSECLARVNLGTAVVGRGKRALVLHERVGQYPATLVIERRAHAGRADVETEDETLSQNNLEKHPGDERRVSH